MFEVRLHGRGGQRVITAAELLSVAAFLNNYEAQAFPSFGSKRMGAPVVSFCRIAQTPIRVAWAPTPRLTRPDDALSCGNCFGCDNCVGVCPDNAVLKIDGAHGCAIDYDYCKGCGLCAEECPCGAIVMEPEQS